MTATRPVPSEPDSNAAQDDMSMRRRDTESVRRLRRELEMAGGTLKLSATAGDEPATGAVLAVDAEEVLAAPAATARFRECVLRVLESRLPVSIAIEALGADAAYGRLRCVCRSLAAVIRDAGADTGAVELVVDADSVSPQTAWSLRRKWLGRGRVFIRAGAMRLRSRQHNTSEAPRSALWLQLWRLRMRRDLQFVYASYVTSPCGLLSAEKAGAVLPESAIQVPADSAWLPIQINVLRFADERGYIDAAAFENGLHRCVDVGDALHDFMLWPTAKMRYDAWLNRRLAIFITGLGDLAERRGLDPRRFTCLTNLDALLRSIRDVLVDRSRAIARHAGNLPALQTADAGLAVPGRFVREDWRKQWHSAIRQAAIRHRNLLVLSPWSLFPSGGPAEFRYANLVPLLAYCDACAFGSPPSLETWNYSQFRNFHQHVSAVLEQKAAAEQIAEQV